MIKKVTISINTKSLVFGAALVIWSISVFGPVGKEIWDGVVTYGELDWWHIISTHSAGITGSTAAFWATMKAYNLIPQEVQDAIQALKESAPESSPLGSVLEQVTEQTQPTDPAATK